MRRVKYWLKTKFYEGTDSWIMRCTHLGEAKLFGYILATINVSDYTWTIDAEKRTAIKLLIKIEKTTVQNYLKLLCKNGLLHKVSQGKYRINDEFISYGDSRKIKKES